MKKGFTLVEILITIAVLAVIAAIAIPGFSKAKSKAAASQAIAYLRTIRTSQKMYAAKWGNYLATPSTEIKNYLRAETQTKDYDFSVTTPTVTTFTATAAKKDNPSNKITLDQDGKFIASGTEEKYQPAS